MSQIPNLFPYTVRLARAADIPAIRFMQERSMWILGGDFYAAREIANFLTLFGTMDDAVVKEGHYFLAEDTRGTILGSGGWTRLQPAYAKATAAGAVAASVPTVRSVFVDPAAKRRGVASAIMMRTERDAVEHRVDALHLTATLSGLPLYEALGYKTLDVTALNFPDLSRFECIRMRKSLAALTGAAA
jgi:GNAT superfamily N-acetyltransferase